MEKIKNLLHPGKSQDDETLYGSGSNTNTGPTGLTGEGSHLASSTGNTSGLAGSQTGTNTTGIGSGTSNIGNTGIASETSTHQSGHGLGSNTTGVGQSSGLAGQGSHLSSGTTSGLMGNQTSGLGNSASTGTGHSTLARDAATTAAATVPGNTGFAQHSNQHGSGRELGSQTVTPASRGETSTGLGSSNTATPHMPGSWDDSYEQGSTNSGLRGTSTSGIGSNTGITMNPSTAPGTSQLSSATGTSGLSQGQKNSHLGRDAAALGTAGAVGEGIHHHHENESGLDSNTANTGSSNTGLGSATVFPPTTSHTTHLGSSSGAPTSSATQSGYGDSNIGNTGASNAGLGTATVFPTTTSHTTQLGSSPSGYPSNTSTLPDRTLGSNTSSTGYGSTQSGNSSHLGRDAVGVGAAGLAAEGIHPHREHERGVRDNGYTGTSRTMPLSSNTVQNTTSTSQPLGASTGYGSNDTGSQRLGTNTVYGSQTGNTTSGHHLGRDAAAVGTAGAVAEGIHYHRENERDLAPSGVTSGSNTYGSTSGPHSTQAANLLDPNVSGGSQKIEDAHVHHPRHGGGAEAADKDHSGSSGSNTVSRDAAIGASGLGGAIGVGEYERRHQGNTGSSGLGSTTGVSQPAMGSSTSRTDPSSTSTDKDHHYGRDAAFGAGGVGAAALAGREYEKHHENKNTGSSGLAQSTSGSSLPGPAPNTAGPHSKDWMNKLDPRVIANPTVAQGNPQAESVLANQQPSAETGGYGGSNTSSGHHYGRDAAIAGGVGGAAYEAEKHHGKHDTQQTTGLGQPGASAISGNTYPTRDASTTSNVAHQGDPTTDSERSKDHHYGRDAAIAGGVGGAAYEADKHHKHDKDLTQAERDAKKQHKHDEKELKKEHKHEEKEARKDSKGGLLGFLHRDKNKKYTPEEEAEFDRQEREHNSHTGRDAALGAGAVGTAGYAAHEHNKTHGTPLDEKPVGKDLGDKLHGVERNRGVPGTSGLPGSEGYGAGSNIHSEASTDQYGRPLDAGVITGTSNAYMPGHSGAGTNVHSEASVDQYGRPLDSGVSTGTGNDYLPAGSQGQGHHLGHDAALGAGAGAGIGGLAAHEHRKHDSEYQPGSTTGFDNQTPVLTGSQKGQHHLERDAALGAGAGGLAAHEYGKHDSGHQQGSTGYDQTSSSGLTGSHQTQGQHHYGRDAAAVGGAGALGEHEYRKHEGSHQAGSRLGSSQYDNPSSTQHQSGHNLGRDATAVGVGEHEYRKHASGTNDPTSSSEYGQQSGTIGSSNYGQQNTTGSNKVTDPSNDGRIGPNVVEGSDGRHRLHKDPPAGHPASGLGSGSGSGFGDKGTGNVLGSGNETQRMMQEGKEELHGDTGVANSRKETSNY